jgi:hypothetical protein
VRAFGPAALLTDRRQVMASAKRNELIHRLRAGRCEICESKVGLQVHHIRELADLNQPGRPKKPSWIHFIAMRRRKTLVICRRCQEDVHTRARHEALPEMITGERGCRETARPVREEDNGKDLHHRYLTGAPHHSRSRPGKRSSRRRWTPRRPGPTPQRHP